MRPRRSRPRRSRPSALRTPTAQSANSTGSVRLRAIVGVPGPPDDSDLAITASALPRGGRRTGLGDCGSRLHGPAAGTGPCKDHRPAQRRIRHRVRHRAGHATAFTVPARPPLPPQRAPTCSADTTLNAQLPGRRQVGRRPGDDSVECSTAGPTDDRPETIMRQGVFVPDRRSGSRAGTNLESWERWSATHLYPRSRRGKRAITAAGTRRPARGATAALPTALALGGNEVPRRQLLLGRQVGEEPSPLGLLDRGAAKHPAPVPSQDPGQDPLAEAAIGVVEDDPTFSAHGKERYAVAG